MTDPENLTNSNTKSLSDPKRNGIVGWLFFLVLSLAAFAFAWFDWPTRYRYDRVNLEEGVSFPVRIDRFSGKTEILYPRGWVDTAAEARSNSAKLEEQVLPPEELQKLSGTAEIVYLLLEINLYNASNWKVNEITVEFWISSKQQGEIRRRYRIRRVSSADPLTTTRFQTDLDSRPEAGQKWGWNIVEAKGTKQ
ncbi:MAG: hypothetical protein ACLQVL_13765 [Terriglobia bacterium]